MSLRTCWSLSNVTPVPLGGSMLAAQNPCCTFGRGDTHPSGRWSTRLPRPACPWSWRRTGGVGCTRFLWVSPSCHVRLLLLFPCPSINTREPMQTLASWSTLHCNRGWTKGVGLKSEILFFKILPSVGELAASGTVEQSYTWWRLLKLIITLIWVDFQMVNCSYVGLAPFK